MAENGEHGLTQEHAFKEPMFRDIVREHCALKASGPFPRKVRVLIADDQQIACEVLKRLLKTEQDVELVGTCSTGPETLEAIKKLNPDLVFLDVQMPGMDGFEVLDKLPEDRSPMIVFVTANETYAGRALKADADFVLKPCTRDRVRTALRHALARSAPKQPGENF